MNKIITILRFCFKGALLILFITAGLLPCPGTVDAGWSDRNVREVFSPGGDIDGEGEEAPPEKSWRDNIRPEPEHKIFATWAYRPLELKEKPPEVTVLAPVWFFVEDKNGDGIPRLMDVNELGRKTDIKAYVDKAHSEGAQVWGTVVSFTPSLSDALIHTPDLRQEFIDKLVYYVETYGLDGINFDFENMNPLHKLDYTAFIKECTDVLRPMGVIISVDVTVKADYESLTNWYQCYDHKSLGEVVDYMAVMTYDEHKNHSGAGPVASIRWVEEKLQGILEDVPSDKVLLGIPFYAYDFKSTMIDGNPDMLVPTWSAEKRGVVTVLKSQIDEMLAKDEYIDMNNQKIEIKEWLVKDEWDDDFGNYYLKFIDQNDIVHEIWYDEPRSLAEKARLVKKYHLAGVAVWRMNFGRPAFWEAIDRELYPEKYNPFP